MPRCQAITGYKARYQVEYHQQCQQQAQHLVDGVGLCGTHYNAAFRKSLTILGELRLLEDTDIAGSTDAGQEVQAARAGNPRAAAED